MSSEITYSRHTITQTIPFVLTCVSSTITFPLGINKEEYKQMIIENVALGMNELALGVALVAMLALLLGVAIKGSRYGVEIEAIRKDGVSKHGLANWLSRFVSGTEYRGYTHQVMSTWKVVDDGSLNSMGIEVVSPPMYSEGRAAITAICDNLRGLASADSSCGLHAHIRILADHHTNVDDVLYGSNNLDEAISLTGWMFRIAFAYNWFQTAIDGFMPPSRRMSNNPSYCGSLQHTVSEAAQELHQPLTNSLEQMLRHGGVDEIVWSQMRSIMSRLMGPRYMNINFGALNKYGTIEFRQHGGTTNPNQINSWVELMARLVLVCREDWKLQSMRDPRSYDAGLSGFMAWLGLHKSDPLAAFYSRRTKRFQGTLIAPCTTCDATNCDGDDYCPRSHSPQPSGYRDDNYRDGDEMEYCEECEEPEDDCECY